MLTFAEFDRLVTSFAHNFVEQKLCIGCHAAILSSNNIEYVAALLALTRIGAISVPLNTRLHVVEMKRQLSQIDLSLVLTDEANRHTAEALHPRVVDIGAFAKTAIQCGDLSNPIDFEPDQEAVVVFTSGSSGTAKGVRLSFGNLYYNALGSNHNIALAPGDTWLMSLPLFHVGGLGILFRCLLAGAQVFVSRRFDALETCSLIDVGAITHLSLVPSMLSQLLRGRNDRAFAKSPKAILLGGAAVPEGLIHTIRALKLPVVVSYGLSEAASQVTATMLGDAPEKLSSSGKTLLYREIRIEKEPNSTIGEICVRGEVVCLGYTGEAILPLSSDMWFYTGDIGSIDDVGYLTVIGRKDGMFISGGENIFPEEIERLVAGIPGVAAAAVVAVDSVEWGKRPVLFIETAGSKLVDERDIAEFLSSRLAKFKLPDKILIVERMPRTTLDKIDRAALLRLAVS